MLINMLKFTQLTGLAEKASLWPQEEPSLLLLNICTDWHEGSWCPQDSLATLSLLGVVPHLEQGRKELVLALDDMNGWLPHKAGLSRPVQKVPPAMKGELLGAEWPGAVAEAACLTLQAA
jgi:hypothetical protein